MERDQIRCVGLLLKFWKLGTLELFYSQSVFRGPLALVLSQSIWAAITKYHRLGGL